MEKYNPNDARLYQVMTNNKTSNGVQTGMYTPGILAKSLRAEFPEIEDASVVLPASWFNDPTTPSGVVSYGDKKLNGNARSSLTAIFSICLPVLSWKGTSSRLFADKKGMFLSASMAERLFGNTQNLIGKDHPLSTSTTLRGDYEIRGIFPTQPAKRNRKTRPALQLRSCAGKTPRS